ncbi:MAG: hypothetical protein LBJ84_04840 [Oscillospiraceae bacterium]|jgi:hypothetical protein|nr:hypothetical protein [Oscillospiraceae bacterium]
MPTYRNDTANPIIVNGVTFAAGAEVAVSFYAPPGTVGLTQIDAAPLVASPILLAGEFTDETVELPYSDGLIVVSALAGSTELRLGVKPPLTRLYFCDDANGVDISGSAYTISGAWESLGKVRIEGTARIVVEKGVV